MFCLAMHPNRPSFRLISAFWIIVACPMGGLAMGQTLPATSMATSPSAPSGDLAIPSRPLNIDMPLPAADAMVATAQQAMQQGRPDLALAPLNSAGQLFELNNRPSRQADSLLVLAEAQESLGDYAAAMGSLEDSLCLSRSLGDQPRQARALSVAGSVQTCLRQFPAAEESLAAAMKTADGADSELRGEILNNRGALAMARGRYAEALVDFVEAGGFVGPELIAAAALSPLTARAAVNAAGAAAAAELPNALEIDQQAIELAWNLPESHDRAADLLSAGMFGEAMAARSSRLATLPASTVAVVTADSPAADRLLALRAMNEAQKTARDIGDTSLECFATGELGHLYESAGQLDDALRLTRRAELLSDPAGPQLYRWQWQSGRILAATQQPDAAIVAYRNAVASVAPVRADLALGYGNGPAGPTFRQTVGPMLFELADLLLRKSDGLAGPDAQASLIEARQTVEQIKSSELQDYFKDDCIDAAHERLKNIGSIAERTAVIYFIPLPDRTETLVQTSTGITRYKLPVGSAELDDTVHRFRQRLEDRTTYRYLTEAAGLYDWLIRPLKSQLEAQQIDTLVFVPDGALLSVPMESLYDGDKFLIEQYAVAVTPGLTLMDPKPIRRQNMQVLVTGLSQSVQGFPELRFVPVEVGSIEKIYGGTELLDRDFVIPNLRHELSSEPFSVIHIASHAYFGGSSQDSFLLTYDGRLSLDDLQRLIAPTAVPSNGKLRPVELLTLSACQTAAGDDRAALGLAGVAIKAGARSAMATLWPVDDQAEATLVSDFYARLKNDPNLSKAKALQQAQQRLMTDRRYSHAFYWSAHLIIGNWL